MDGSGHALRPRSRNHALGRAHEQIVLEQLPQTPQSVTDSRLTHPEPPARTSKALRLRDRVEDDQEI